MKKKITVQISAIVFLAMALFIIANYLLQALAVQSDMIAASEEQFWQLDQLIEENNESYQVATNDFRDICILRTRAAAYMVEHTPGAVGDLDKLKKILKLLEVDELHVFDREGTIISGTEPKYYGMNMTDGEQISFFLPMLKDRSLTLCQDIMGNTAENKAMQYAAVWMESGDYIVQCGLAPERLQAETKKNEIAYLFSLLTHEGGDTLFAVDPDNYKIIGSTNGRFVGRNLESIGISVDRLEEWDEGFHSYVGGRFSYCVFRKNDTMILGRVCTATALYRNLTQGNIRLVIYMVIALLLVIYYIYQYIDKNVVDSIEHINGKLALIADGNLSEQVDVRGTREFEELSGHINFIVKSLLGSTEKISRLIEVTGFPMGVYEYNVHMSGVRTTRRLARIIGADGAQADRLFSDFKQFERWMEDLKTRPAEYMENLYILPGTPDRYIQITSFEEGSDRYGLIIDKTEEVRKYRELELKLDQDELTGLCSRYFFYRQLEQMFLEPKKLGHAMMLMVDSDDLKTVNDTYGHETGDRYLCRMADALRTVEAENKIIARLGGDEFAMFIYGVKDDSKLQAYIERLKTVRSETVLAPKNGEIFPVRFSVGYAFLKESADYHELLEKADSRMYADKQKRKKTVDKTITRLSEREEVF